MKELGTEGVTRRHFKTGTTKRDGPGPARTGLGGIMPSWASHPDHVRISVMSAVLHAALAERARRG